MIARPDPQKMLARFDDAAIAAMNNMIEAREYREAIVNDIAILGPGIIRALDSHNIKIRSVGAKSRIGEMSEVIKRFGITIHPGVQGLYVPFDKALYIVEPAIGVANHECGHALDHILAPNAIPEGFDPLTASLQECAKIKPFMTQTDSEFTTRFVGNKYAVSAYGATSRQEAFAEAVRAFTNCNDTGNLFDELSAAKYRTMNRSSYAFMLELFIRYYGRSFEKWRHADTLAA
jgi:hypothetical protein